MPGPGNALDCRERGDPDLHRPARHQVRQLAQAVPDCCPQCRPQRLAACRPGGLHGGQGGPPESPLGNRPRERRAGQGQPAARSRPRASWTGLDHAAARLRRLADQARPHAARPARQLKFSARFCAIRPHRGPDTGIRSVCPVSAVPQARARGIPGCPGSPASAWSSCSPPAGVTGYLLAFHPGSKPHAAPLPSQVVSFQTVGLITQAASAGSRARPAAAIARRMASAARFTVLSQAEAQQGSPQWTADQMAGGSYIFIYLKTGQCLAVAGPASQPEGRAAALRPARAAALAAGYGGQHDPGS